MTPSSLQMTLLIVEKLVRLDTSLDFFAFGLDDSFHEYVQSISPFPFLTAYIQSMVTRIPGTTKHVCNICGYSSRYANVAKHAIAKHTNIRFPCQYCDKIMTEEGSRVTHYKRVHKLAVSAAQIRAMIKQNKDDQ